MKRSAGFTLIEVAMTLLIVGLCMLMVLQGLNGAKMTAAQTRNIKLARDLARQTLGQVASGQFQEDIEAGLSGTYAEEGYPQFSFEVLVGDDTFDTTGGVDDGTFDTWRHQQQLKEERESEREREADEKEDPQEREEPFEKVKIKVTFLPKIRVGETEQKNELVLEEWMPWKQVYGSKDEEDPAAAADAGAQPPAAGGGK